MSQNKSRKTPSFPIHTSQEVEAIGQAAADGKRGLNYSNLEDWPLGVRMHATPGSSHSVRLRIAEGENGFEAIERLTGEQDVDSHLAILYIANLLAAPFQLPANEEDSWVDFDDVIAKIGWDPRSTEERREMHRRICGIIQFAERAVVIGKRGGYEDKHSKKTVETEIESSLWRIHEVERPTQLAMVGEVPIKAQVIITPRWVPFLSSPQMAQFLPLGEVLGAIPGNKPSGAWARVIGLALASFWRRNPRESSEGTLKPTRRELLERYHPKTGPVSEILTGNNPKRAMTYWCDALTILKVSGFLDDFGETKATMSEMSKRFPRKGWGEDWLNEKVELHPGASLKPVIEGRALALPTSLGKRRGRPKKI